MTSTDIIHHTKKWISSFIINLNICPFAKKPFSANQIHYTVIHSPLIEQCLTSIITECERLDHKPNIETTLIIFPDNFELFDDFLDFVALSDDLLNLHNYQGCYQLASFHPQYQFDSEPKNDPANYTNKSPYPMLHLIREASISNALSVFTKPHLIPENNISLTRKLGRETLQKILDTCLN